MDSQRAKEILESTHMISVTMSGIPIYIQKVNEDQQTARVFPLDEPNHEQEVTLDKLVEQQ
jgi:small acid-soluble spore protein H (minor)